MFLEQHFICAFTSQLNYNLSTSRNPFTMKFFFNLGLVTVAVTGAVAQHQHQHAHLHPARAAAVTETVPGPMVTVYELDGKVISYDAVQAGLKNGIYVLVGNVISSVSVPPPTTVAPPPAPETPSSAAVFLQSSTIVPVPTTTAAPPPPPPSSVVAPVSSSVPSSGGAGDVNADFPSGTIPCSTFPSAYGAVPVNGLGMMGWIGIQNTPNYAPGADAISYIETAISGSGCTENSFCSYACPPGYQKSQWPSAQGNTGQSIGGLYCNTDGMLELARDSVSQICIPGIPGIQVTNNIGSNVAFCRTDYPGTESETVPLDTQPGTTLAVSCPDSADYYEWNNLPTTAQWYINPAGVSVDDACQWGSSAENYGNWAPINMGCGKDASGNTFLSLFPNTPTTTNTYLSFSVQITGSGVSGDCSYSGGTFYQDGSELSTGCTVSSALHLILFLGS